MPMGLTGGKRSIYIQNKCHFWMLILSGMSDSHTVDTWQEKRI